MKALAGGPCAPKSPVLYDICLKKQGGGYIPDAVGRPQVPVAARLAAAPVSSVQDPQAVGGDVAVLSNEGPQPCGTTL